MRSNLFQERLAAGEMPKGHMVWEFATRGMPRILDAAGLDFVVYDMEHSGFDLGAIADLLSANAHCRLTPFVRIPQDQYHFVARVLDAGAMGIMVPNVKNAEQARALVQYAKYPPTGIRGLGLGTAHNNYAMPSPAAYLAEANARTTVICQIEHPEGVRNAHEIAAVEGVDVLWVGHFDLSANQGIVGEFTHPDFLAALDTVVAAARTAGKVSAIQPGTPEQFQAWKARGFQVLSYGADFNLYRAALSDALARW
ncbi:MAG: aldolase/citrate lyase family protein [Bryobacter sp.]|nr:aldolase/citrate lyase family protein [Bryobacter sp.]